MSGALLSLSSNRGKHSLGRWPRCRSGRSLRRSSWPSASRPFAVGGSLSVAKSQAYDGINLADLHRLPIAVPPLAERKRILAEVEHLMRPCDDLEAKLRRADGRASKLVEAVVQEMVP